MEILRWLRWQWRQFESWQKFWFLGAFFLGAGLGADDSIKKYFFAIPVVIFMFYTIKWAVYEPILHSWGKYKEQRDTLFDTIRGDKE